MTGIINFVVLVFNASGFTIEPLLGKYAKYSYNTVVSFYGNEKKKNVVKTWPYGFAHDVTMIKIY